MSKTSMIVRLAVGISACAALTGWAPPTAAADHHLLQGFWEPPREGMTKFIERPQLTDKGRAAVEAKRVALDTKDGVSAGSRYCLPSPQPWILFQSAPIDIVQDARETMMAFEGHPIPSHIYTDGRDHSAAAKMKPQVNGHSIGRWDGDTFVVDTVRFAKNEASPGGNFQGGVPNSPTSHLTARFTPAADGQNLDATFTVEDPEYLVKPYSWTFHWKRSGPGSYAALGECDPGDPAYSVH